jgi:hypothetical protein
LTPLRLSIESTAARIATKLLTGAAGYDFRQRVNSATTSDASAD